MPSLEVLSVPDAIRALVWRCSPEVSVVSSASVGDAFGVVGWIANVQVPLDFARTDLDIFAAEVADELGLVGAGVVLLTAAEIGRWERASDSGVVVDATVGISKPTWAASPDDGFTPWRPGTINLIAHLPVPMTPAAMVGAVITVTEAKAQALAVHGVPGTGTASDAVVITAPVGEGGSIERFAGPRSRVGAALARATFEAVARRAAASGPVDPDDTSNGREGRS